MDNNFAKTIKTLIQELFKLSKPSLSEPFSKNWDPSYFLLYDVKRHQKKIEKADDPETLQSRQMEKQIKPN